MSDEPIPTRPYDELDDLDGQILADLRRACERHDPLPDGMISRLTYQMTLAGLQAELAELTLHEQAGVRSGEPALTDTLTFRGTSLSLMVRLHRHPQGSSDDARASLDLDGWVSTPGARVELWVEGEAPWEADADADGRVAFRDVPSGPARFIVRPADAPALSTPTVEL